MLLQLHQKIHVGTRILRMTQMEEQISDKEILKDQHQQITQVQTSSTILLHLLVNLMVDKVGRTKIMIIIEVILQQIQDKKNRADLHKHLQKM